jgi:catechol 2,3-dioxygenase-like lactoylglutathione lyase family enzyme
MSALRILGTAGAAGEGLERGARHPYPRSMNINPSLHRTCIRLFKLLAATHLLAMAPAARAAETEFSKPIIDFGIVVKDSDRTARFLTNVIGFKEVSGFPVSSDLGKKIGLVDGHATQVRVFVLEDIEPATRLKLLSFPEAPGKQSDQAYIHSTLGIRYLTLYVKDLNRVLERVKKAGVATLGETPVEIGAGTWLLAVKDPDGNFIELIGPRR